MLLELAGADYTIVPVDIFNGQNKTPEYLALHPFAKVPTLEVEGTYIYESPAIADYLDATVAGGRYTPTEPLTRARMRQIMAVIDNYLYAPAIGAIAIQRLIVPSQGGVPDEAKVAAAVPLARQALQALDAIATGSPYLLGERLTVADLYLAPTVFYLAETPEFAAVMEAAPTLRTWWKQTQTWPVLQKVCA